MRLAFWRKPMPRPEAHDALDELNDTLSRLAAAVEVLRKTVRFK